MGVVMPAIEPDELSRDQVDAFIARNREALNDSFNESVAELDQGIFSNRTITDVIADGHKRHGIKD